MLLSDAWFDTITSSPRDEQLVAILEAVCAELPLAALCGWIVLDTKRFHEAAARMYLEGSRRRNSGAEASTPDRSIWPQEDSRSERLFDRRRPGRRQAPRSTVPLAPSTERE